MGELAILRSPYRSVTRPLHSYVKRRLKQNPGGFIHVVLGELRTGNPLSQILHQNAHFIEQLALGDLDGVVTTIVPFPLEHSELHDDDQSQDAQSEIRYCLGDAGCRWECDGCGSQCERGFRMMNIAISVIITDILWVMVIVGWILSSSPV
ncbi:MAG: hypothetical protein IPK16_19070 [Anaerolineales bacterium]|nr:hypothetical protein [Anaerolineales bacterium]